MEYQGHPADREPVVLCIDDDAGVLAALRSLMRSEPYEVVTAASAAQGLALLRARPVEVVVADERMPGIGGCELLAEVRQRWPWIGRIILTAHPGYSVVVRGFRAGVDVLLPKPWDDLFLKKTIRNLIFGEGPVRPPAEVFIPAEGRHLVVLVDDEPGVLAALKRSLAREPYTVLTTTCPTSALRWVDMLDVAAVVSDERMQNMSGTDLLARVYDRSPQTARILLTAYGGATARCAVPGQPAQCIIAKPWDDAMLRQALHDFLSVKRPTASGPAVGGG